METPIPEPRPEPTDAAESCSGALLHLIATAAFTFITMLYWLRTVEVPIVPEAEASLMMLLHLGSMATAWLGIRHIQSCVALQDPPPRFAGAVGPVLVAFGALHLALVTSATIH